MAQNTRANSAAAWNQHREKITRLYIQENLPLGGENGIIARMKRENGFSHSKQQYEYEMKKWGLRKNLKKSEWQSIIAKLRQNDRQGLLTEVKFNGSILSKKKIANAIAHYGAGKEMTSQQFRDPASIDIAGVTLRVRPKPQFMTTTITPLTPREHHIESRSCTISQPTENMDLVMTPLPSNFNSIIIRPGYEIPVDNFDEPFSWFKALDWKLWDQYTSSSQLSTLKQHNLDNIFYSREISVGPAQFMIPKSLVAALLNSIHLGNGLTNRAIHTFLRSVPLPIVRQFFGSLDPGIFEMLRERVFAEAVQNEDEKIIAAMLELGADPLEHLHFANGFSESALSIAYLPLKLSIFGIILDHMILKTIEIPVPMVIKRLIRGKNIPFTKHVIDKAVESGQVPTFDWLSSAVYHDHIIAYILRKRHDGVNGWIKSNVLERCICKNRQDNLWVKDGNPSDRMNNVVFNYLLVDNIRLILLSDPEIKAALSTALQKGILDNDKWAVDMLLQACRLMGLLLQFPGMDVANTTKAIHQFSSSPPRKIKDEPKFSDKPEFSMKDLKDAISRNDLNYVVSALENPIFTSSYRRMREALELSAKLGSDNISNKIMRFMINDYTIYNRELWNVMRILLEYDRISLVSDLVVQARELRDILRCEDTSHAIFDHLERHLIRIIQSRDWRREDLLLRSMAYHAIAVNNRKLMSWLLDNELDVNAVMENYEKGYSHWSIQYETFDMEYYPSILAIAAQLNRTDIMIRLLEWDAGPPDSLALFYAINYKSKTETIDILLKDFERQGSFKRRHYGSLAIRKAIQRNDLPTIHKLVPFVDLEGFETIGSSENKISNYMPLHSPLAEAIIQKNLVAAQILLESGVDPNKIASKGSLKDRFSEDIFLDHRSAILVAISVGYLPMIEKLVHHGAEIDHPPRFQLTRTPLQLAAETGNMEIVKYLLKKGASVDSFPLYSGGTPLQLAALQGHVGVATFLIEKGADPNFPPARGDGRTAFEAAAEWSRLDMMLLLMRHGTDLDLEVFRDESDIQYAERQNHHFNRKEYDGLDIKTQYTRAKYFAKRAGYPASARFVDHLYQRFRGAVRRNESNDALQGPTAYTEHGSRMDSLGPNAYADTEPSHNHFNEAWGDAQDRGAYTEDALGMDLDGQNAFAGTDTFDYFPSGSQDTPQEASASTEDGFMVDFASQNAAAGDEPFNSFLDEGMCISSEAPTGYVMELDI